MPEIDQYPVLDELRAQAADGIQSLVQSLFPAVAERLADRSAIEPAVRHALNDAADALSGGLAARAEIAASLIEEMHFRLLRSRAPERRSGRRSQPFDARTPAAFPALLVDVEPLVDGAARRLAARVVDAGGDAIDAYWRRLEIVTGRPASDAMQPMGACGHALALLGACRPYVLDAALIAHVEAVLTDVAVMPLAGLLARLDQSMAARGILPELATLTSPSIEPPVHEPVGTVVDGPVAGLADHGQPDADDKALHNAGDDLFPDTVPMSMSGEPAAPERLEQMSPHPIVDDTMPPVLEPDGSAHPSGNTHARVESGAELRAPRSAAADAIQPTHVAGTTGGMTGGNPMTSVQSAHPGFRQADRLPDGDDLERDGYRFAERLGIEPFTADARHAYFGEMREHMKRQGAEQTQLVALDLIMAMFDHALNDDRIPEPIRVLLWRLQHPAMVLAALDPGYLGDDERSIRRLVENIVAVAVAHPDNARPSRTLYHRLRTVVRAVEVIAHSFRIRSRAEAHQVDQEYERASRGMMQLVARVQRDREALDATQDQRNRRDYTHRPSGDQEVELTQRIRHFLSQRIEGRDVPDAVVDFLLDAWVRHMRTLALRHGEQSHQFHAGADTVDELLWTLDGRGGQRSGRRELAARIPRVIEAVTHGIDDIGARREQYGQFFDDMFAVHLRRLNRDGRSSSAFRSAGSERRDLRDARGSGKSRMADGSRQHEVAMPELPARGIVPAAPRIPVRADHPLVDDPDRDDDARFGQASVATRRRPASHEIDPPSAGYGAARVADMHVDAASGDDHAVLDQGRGASGAMVDRTDDDVESSGRDAMDAGENEELMHSERQAESEMRLRRLVEQTSITDAPIEPERIDMSAEQLGNALEPGQWLELVSSSGTSSLAKVAWMNERRTVALLLQHPDRLVLSRHVSALIERAVRGRVFRVR